jgi:hypothetical protein
VDSGVLTGEGRTCPECGARGSVRDDVCDLCFADLGEYRGPWVAAALPPAIAPAEIRFSDVLAELGSVVSLAAEAEDGSAVMAAGHRAERLLKSLRVQFLSDIGLVRVAERGMDSPIPMP